MPRILGFGGQQWRLSTPDDGAPAAGWFVDAFWVDASNPTVDPPPDGSMLNPFVTIQEAVDAAAAAQDARPVGHANPTERAQTRQQIIVASGFYDEDIDILRGDTFLEFLACGPVTLGDGSADDDFASTTPRNVTWLNDQAQEDADSGAVSENRQPQLVFGVFPQFGEMSSTHTAVASGWTISGTMFFTNPGGSTSAEVHLQNVKIVGGIDGTADVGIRNCYFYRCFVDASIAWSNANIQIAESCEFDGPTTIATYGRLVECEINGAFTTSGFAPGLVPGGFIGCYFDATAVFTGPVGPSCFLDGVSNYWFKTNGAALGGGATKVITDDLVP